MVRAPHARLPPSPGPRAKAAAAPDRPCAADAEPVNTMIGAAARNERLIERAELHVVGSATGGTHAEAAEVRQVTLQRLDLANLGPAAPTPPFDLLSVAGQPADQRRSTIGRRFSVFPAARRAPFERASCGCMSNMVAVSLRVASTRCRAILTSLRKIHIVGRSTCTRRGRRRRKHFATSTCDADQGSIR
jgi:hypothetical protein